MAYKKTEEKFLIIFAVFSFIIFIMLAGYLVKHNSEIGQWPQVLPTSILTISPAPSLTVTPTTITKNEIDDSNNYIEPAAEDTERKTYRNIEEGNKAYKLMEIKIPNDWQVTAGTNESFTQSLKAYYPENNSKLGFSLDIMYDLETDLRNTEKEFTPVILSGISETLMRREITKFDSETDREVNSIETYIMSGAYY